MHLMLLRCWSLVLLLLSHRIVVRGVGFHLLHMSAQIGSAHKRSNEDFSRASLYRETMSAPVAAKHNISKKRKFVADGVFYAELREFLSKELAEDGFSGVEVRKTPIRTEIIIRATRTMEVLGPNGRRIRELTSLVQKRFGFTEGTVSLLLLHLMPRAFASTP
jgi:hypothetical protein